MESKENAEHDGASNDGKQFKETLPLSLSKFFTFRENKQTRTEEERIASASQAKKATRARIDRFVEDAVSWYRANAQIERKKNKVYYLIYPVLRPPPLLLMRALMCGNPFMPLGSPFDVTDNAHSNMAQMGEMTYLGNRLGVNNMSVANRISGHANLRSTRGMFDMKGRESGNGPFGHDYAKNFNGDVEHDVKDNDDDDDDNNASDESNSNKSSSNNKNNKGKDERKIRRYPLPRRHGKTFNTLFFNHKDNVIQLLDDFAQRRHKFAIPGCAQKMTWLLYGPPGTGKTSLVKAMAHYLRRHVVIINLAAIRSFRELQDWMHDPFVTAENEAINSENSDSDSDSDDYYDEGNASNSYSDSWDQRHWSEHHHHHRHRGGWRQKQRFILKAKSVIYLLEDIDAVSVEDISDHDICTGNVNDTLETTCNNNYCKDARVCSKTNVGESTIRSCNVEEHNNNKNECEANRKSNEKKVQVETVKIKSMCDAGNCGKFNKGKKPHSGLTVNDVVRVLTNPVAPPGRFVVLTTNHIENVHPRLLQFNVMDDRIMMGYVNVSNAQKIIEHYYQCKLTSEQTRKLEGIAEFIEQCVQKEFSSVWQRTCKKEDHMQRNNALSMLHSSSLCAQYNGFSPALLEQMCAEEETVNDLLDKLYRNHFQLSRRDDIEVF